MQRELKVRPVNWQPHAMLAPETTAIYHPTAGERVVFVMARLLHSGPPPTIGAVQIGDTGDPARYMTAAALPPPLDLGAWVLGDGAYLAALGHLYDTDGAHIDIDYTPPAPPPPGTPVPIWHIEIGVVKEF